MQEPSILIVGAGPTGLTAAAELARHGVSSRLIDKAPIPSDKSRAFGIHARTMELFHLMGTVEPFLAIGNKAQGLSFYNQGQSWIRVRMEMLDSRYPFFCIVAQADTERILTQHLSSLGIEPERGVELVSLLEAGDRVEVRLRHADGHEEEAAYHWVIGCDGAHSAVRHQLQLEFKGAPYPNYWLLADLDLDWQYPRDELSVFLHPRGVTAFFPLYGQRGRLMFELPDQPIDRELEAPTLDDVYRLATERGIAYHAMANPVWLAHFKLHHRLVDRYRRGRVFLAGDAAHIHSPLGGQGMNTGIQDAINLAWKLAWVERGRARLELLETYELERRRVAVGVVEKTDLATKAVGLRNPVLQAIRNRVMATVTRIDAVQQRILDSVSQIEVHYKGSPLGEQRWTPTRHVKGFTPQGEDLEPGERVGDHTLYGEEGDQTTQLFDLFKGAELELLLFTGVYPDEGVYRELDRIHRHVAETWPGLIEVHLIKGLHPLPSDFRPIASTHVDRGFAVHAAFGAGSASLYLIRPDGYVTFRSQPANQGDLEAYLSTHLIRTDVV